KRVKSYIHSVEDNGSSVTQESQIRESARAYFHSLFSSERDLLTHPDPALFPTIPQSVDLVDLYDLPSKEEIREAVFGIDPNSVSVRELGTNYFQFLFPNRAELNKILEGKNWIFENQHIVLKEWQEGISANHPCFDYLTLWVQAHGIPINWMSTEVGIKLGRVFSNLKNVNMAKAGGQGERVMRLQVDIDLKEPLPRWTKIRLGQKVATNQFQYKKLVSLCFYCGKVGHSDKSCSQKQEDISNHSVHEGQFGEWMTAVDGAIISQTPSQSYHSEPTAEGVQTQNTNQASGKESDASKQTASKTRGFTMTSKNTDDMENNNTGIEGSSSSIPLSQPPNKGKEIVTYSQPTPQGQDVNLLEPAESNHNMEIVSLPVSTNNDDIIKEKQTLKCWKRAPSKIGRLARHQGETAAISKQGGLLLMWDCIPTILNTNSSDFFIQVQLSLPNEEIPLWLTFVYMSTDKETRIQQWEFLEQSKEDWEDYWAIIGDWNDICNHDEKRGGRTISNSSFNAFNSFISSIGMVEINMTGYQYTWGNNRMQEGFVEEKLDRGFGSLLWTTKHPQASIANIFKSASDHGVLLLDDQGSSRKQKKRFNFDKRWIKREGFKEEIEKAWAIPQQGTPFYKLKEHVKQARLALSKWSKLFRADHKEHVAALSLKLEEMRQLGEGKNWEEWESIKQELEKEQISEEAFWQQRSKIQWLKEGDRNSHFFHAFTMQRRKQNAISRLLSDQYGIYTKKEEIAKEISNYYHRLFTSEGSHGAQEITNLIPRSINSKMNEQLQAPTCEDEIKAVLFQMNPLKVPGEDGMTPLFCQHFWPILKEDISAAVISFFSSGQLLKYCNHTLVTLISKCLNPSSIS
ncbi:Unknown protein, partial [Striga hermonthica]